MKLNINPKELLALHNLLYEQFDGRHCMDECKDEDGSSDETQLRQVYNRIRACLIASLSNKMVDPFESWAEGQQRKIDDLKKQNDELTEKARQDIRSLKEWAEENKKDQPVILSADDAEVTDEYPRKAPKPQAPRSGKFHGHRR